MVLTLVAVMRVYSLVSWEGPCGANDIHYQAAAPAVAGLVLEGSGSH